MNSNSTPRVNKFIGVIRDTNGDGRPSYGMSSDWHDSYCSVVDFARELECMSNGLAEALRKLMNYIPRQECKGGNWRNGHYESTGEELQKVLDKCDTALAIYDLSKD